MTLLVRPCRSCWRDLVRRNRLGGRPLLQSAAVWPQLRGSSAAALESQGEEDDDGETFPTPVVGDGARARPDVSAETKPKIGTLILVRHGQSEWNVTDPTRNLTARFTGWADINLTQQGRDQAVAAGHAIREAANEGIIPSKEIYNNLAGGGVEKIPQIDVVFCSLLKRSSDTMDIILEEIQLAKRIEARRDKRKQRRRLQQISPPLTYAIPIIYSWRLNERHYGALVGLSKEGAERLYGKVRLTRWRDSWDVPPPPMPLAMVKRWGREEHCRPVTIVKKGEGGRTCVFDPATTSVGGASHKILERRRARESMDTSHETTSNRLPEDDEDSSFMPPSESLRNTYERFMPLWIQGIAPHLRAGRTVLVAGHANTIRSMLFAIDGEVVNRTNSKKVKIPSALPLVYEFVDADGSGCLEVTEEMRQQQPHEEDGNSVQSNPKAKCIMNGRECSDIVPGNLRVIKPDRSHDSLHQKEEVRYQLNGTWVETDETKSVSFCTDAGQKMGEGDIA